MGERPVAVMRPIDPTLFNPLQFQSRSLLSLCKSSMWSWFSERLDISFPGLIREHHQSLVSAEEGESAQPAAASRAWAFFSTRPAPMTCICGRSSWSWADAGPRCSSPCHSSVATILRSRPR